MQLNRRHKVGLFLTIVIVGAGLLFDVGAKESVGIALLGLATSWLVGSVSLRKQGASQVSTPRVSETPGAGQASEQALAPKEEQGPESGNMAVPSRQRGSWFWMVVSALSFSALLGLAIFNLTWQVVAGEYEKGGESLGRMLIPLFAVGYGANRAWKSLLKQEPKDSPESQRKLRRFNVIGGICTIVVLCSALGLGVAAGRRIEKNKRVDATLREIEKLEPKSAELRAQVKAVLSEDTPRFEDYYLRCLKLEKVLDEYNLQEQHVVPLLNSILVDAGNQTKLAEIVTAIQRINDEDAEVVKLFRLEIAKGKELISLPTSQRASFYREEIMPLKHQAARVADEEIIMMREAERKGLKWPSDVKELLH